MQCVFVLDKNRKPLMPCHPARARQLLREGKAAVFRRQPFTIILKERESGDVQPVEVRLDPGSKTIGMAVVALFGQGWTVLWAANLAHRGQTIKLRLDKRRSVRSGRRNRKTRYRPVRFSNRTRPDGWLPPSLRSRVENVFTWTRRLTRYAPISQISVETVRFDTQKLVNPEVSGAAYQQGDLFGYEVREYLLEKWERKCAYCDAQNIPLQVEHIIPRSRGGTDRVSNLTLACEPCNRAKDNRDVREFLAGQPDTLKRILAQAKAPLKDAAAVNSVRYATGSRLRSLGLSVSFWSGGRTKFNRVRCGYPKDHWIDAACVGENPAVIPTHLKPILIKAMGWGSRQMCRMDKYGFPRTGAKQAKRVHGFQTGDLVKAVVLAGKKAGTYAGRVAVRASGSFRVGLVDGISWRYCHLAQRQDGYDYGPLRLEAER
jgi:5-methylcytosine-specific restriction endonuclease McrA